MRVLAIDPGNTESALVEWDGKATLYAAILPNARLLGLLRDMGHGTLAIEQVCSYGMAVGREVFDTVWWSGRFTEAHEARGGKVLMVPRLKVKTHLCHDSRAKDGNIAQALRDRFGGKGTKKAPGPFYGIKSHLWAAVALAVTVHDGVGAVPAGGEGKP